MLEYQLDINLCKSEKLRDSFGIYPRILPPGTAILDGRQIGYVICEKPPGTHRRSAASTVLSSVYGWPPIEVKDDGLVARINDLMHRLVRSALPGAYLVEIFPLMKYLPPWAAKWKREGLDWHAKDTKMFEDMMRDVQDRVVSALPIVRLTDTQFI